MGALSPLQRNLTTFEPARFFDWWLGGLKACVPAAIRRGWGRRRTPVLVMGKAGFVLQLEGSEGSEDLAQLADLDNLTLDRWLGPRQRKVPLVLRVGAEHVFTRSVSLPQAAADNLRQVLRFEMDRLTPFAADDVLFDYRLSGRQSDRGQIQVDLAVLRKSLVDAPLAQLAAGRWPVRVIDAPGLWPGANLLKSGAPRSGRRWIALRWVAASTLLLLLVAVLVTPLLQARQVVIDIDTRLAAVRKQALQVGRLEQQLEQQSTLVNFVRLRRLERRPTVKVLLALAETLPDDTWLQSLSVRGADVTLQGQSAQATRLVELLEETPEFESVAFTAPLTPMRGGSGERFSIAMKLSAGESP